MENYYSTAFELSTKWNLSISEAENMIPWERKIYIMQVLNELERRKRENGS